MSQSEGGGVGAKRLHWARIQPKFRARVPREGRRNLGRDRNRSEPDRSLVSAFGGPLLAFHDCTTGGWTGVLEFGADSISNFPYPRRPLRTERDRGTQDADPRHVEIVTKITDTPQQLQLDYLGCPTPSGVSPHSCQS